MKILKTIGWAMLTIIMYSAISFMLTAYLLSDTISGVKLWQ